MIGADTNLLVRVILADNEHEAAIARKFLKKATDNKQLFISSYAILEMVWVLKVKNRSRAQICDAVLTLLDSPGIVIGQKTTVMNALEKYSKGTADFGDYLILAEGETHHTPTLATFDKTLCKDDSRCLSPAGY